MTKFNFLKTPLNISVTLIILLVILYIYVIMYNYLYKKYKKRAMSEKHLFDVSSFKETLVSMFDVLLFSMLFTINVNK